MKAMSMSNVRLNGLRWAERGLKAHANPDRQGLFGIVQGADLKIYVVKVLKI